jgi:hypothetical protein
MQRLLTFAAVLLLSQFILVSSQAQKATPEGLPGRWVGAMHSGHGDQNVTAIFKQEKAAYSGTMTWMDGKDKPLTNVKLEGNTLTAEAEVEIPDGKLKLSYILTLKGDILEGVILSRSGHSFEIDLKLKRAVKE